MDSNPYDPDAPAWDVAIVTADGYDQPITAMEEPVGEFAKSETVLIQSYLDDDPGMTVGQAVGIFGMKGMYRELRVGQRRKADRSGGVTPTIDEE